MKNFIYVFLLWCVWPGAMWIVGWIGESRTVPVWRHQSKMFFPGDLVLWPMALTLHAIPAPISSDWLTLAFAISGCIGMLLFYSIRRGESKNYDWRALHSPTKVTHDLFGYFLFPTMLLGLGVPKLLACIIKASWAWWWAWVAFAALGIFYIGCAVWDAKHPFTEEDVLARHPVDWRPIWKK